MINPELYIPKFTKISSIRQESDLVKTYKLRVDIEFKPGQFVQVSVLGAGEVPISISSSPCEKRFAELTVRSVGKVTSALHNLNRGDFVGLRGPYGNFFPIEEVLNKDLIFIAGGIGLAPLRSLIKYVLDNRKKYGRLYLLYGARRQEELLFKEDLKRWYDLKDFDVHLTVDKAQSGWTGNVGVVTALFKKLKIDAKRCTAYICGPPIMIKYALQGLSKLGLKDRDIIITLERYMKCGVGKCGHCYLVNKYVCTDGPVFSYFQLKGLRTIEMFF
jgi:sulfite reductase subunit B